MDSIVAAVIGSVSTMVIALIGGVWKISSMMGTQTSILAQIVKTQDEHTDRLLDLERKSERRARERNRDNGGQ